MWIRGQPLNGDKIVLIQGLTPYSLIWVGLFHDAPHGHSTVRLLNVMRTHRGSFPALCSALRHVRTVTTMASADFCLITRQVALQGAMRILLVLLPMIRSYPAIATEYAWTFISPVARSGISHKADLIACETDLPG